jgi:hypothetical protein
MDLTPQKAEKPVNKSFIDGHKAAAQNIGCRGSLDVISLATGTAELQNWPSSICSLAHKISGPRFCEK